MRDEHGVCSVRRELLHHLARPGGVGHHLVGDSVETGRQLRDADTRIDERVEGVIGAHHPTVHPHRTDGHEPVAGVDVQTGGLTVDDREDDVP